MTGISHPTRFLIGLAVACAAATHPLLAANGDIPIFQPTTITAPGRYIVTRDFTAPGDAIVIQTGGVTLDLNGHTLTPVAGSGVVLDIPGQAGLPRPIRIVEGRIVGGDTGIRGVSLPAVIPVIIDKVGITGPNMNCIDLPGSSLEVRGSVLQQCGQDGIRMDGNGAGVLEVENTTITDVQGSGIFADTVDGVTVRASTIRRFGFTPGIYGQAGVWVLTPGKVGLSVLDSVLCDGSTLGVGIRLWLGGATGITGPNRIINNQIGGNGAYGIDLRYGTAHITGNVIAGNSVDGIQVDAAGIVTPSMITGNSLLRNGVNGANILGGSVRFNGNTVGGNSGDGVRVAGVQSIIENNYFEGNTGAGIRFLNGTGHAYRTNFVRGNTGGDVQDPFSNTDAGGNIK